MRCVAGQRTREAVTPSVTTEPSEASAAQSSTRSLPPAAAAGNVSLTIDKFHRQWNSRENRCKVTIAGDPPPLRSAAKHFQNLGIDCDFPVPENVANSLPLSRKLVSQSGERGQWRGVY